MNTYKRKTKIPESFERMHLMEEKSIYGEATRSRQEYSFHLIPPEAMFKLAQRFYLGEQKHGEGNWKHGDKQFIKQLFNHLQLHLNKLLNMLEPGDDHIGALLWAGSALAWYWKNKPDMYLEALLDLQKGLKSEPKNSTKR